MDARQPGAGGLIAQIVERIARGRDAAQPLTEFPQVVDREIGPPLDAPVGRMGEVAFDEDADDLLPARPRDRAGIEQARRVGGAALAQLGRVDVYPVVVGPHQREFQAVAVRRAQEAHIQRPFEERPILIVVPVEEEGRHAVIGRRGDLAAHHGGVALVLLAPQRGARLAVAGEARLGAPGQLPLGPAGAVDARVARVGVVGREVVAGDFEICSLGQGCPPG